MRAVVLQEKGGPRSSDVGGPDPNPAQEVLVDIVSTAVNRADLLQRMGLYPGPPMAHEIPGLEFAGRVVAIGNESSSMLSVISSWASTTVAVTPRSSQSTSGCDEGSCRLGDHRCRQLSGGVHHRLGRAGARAG